MPSPPVIWIERAVAPDLARRTDHVELNVALEVGLQAVVGTPADGTLDLGLLASGFASPRSGVVRVAGGHPGRDPRLRARIGATLADPRLPSLARVKDLFALVGGTGVPAEAVLERFGLGHWRDRPGSSLSRREKRALELVLALSVPSPVAVLLTEPAVDMADIDREAVTGALVAAADAGACVVVITASVSDAIEMAPRIHLIEAGRLVRSVPASEPSALAPGRGVSLRIEADLTRVLAAALADDPAVTAVDWDQTNRSILTVRGQDLDALALAVARAAISNGAAVRSIVPVAPQLAEVRAATAGLAWAAYQAAYQAWAQERIVAPPPEGQS
jgi:ABC-type multidrug transport system ATPase subunit